MTQDRSASYRRTGLGNYWDGVPQVVQALVTLFLATGYGITLYLLTISGTNHTDQRFFYNLVPFRTIVEAFQSGANAPMMRVVLNLLVTVPVAALIVLLERERPRFGRAAAVIFGTSLLIELLQLVLNTGRSADVDDLMLNTVGGFAAYVLLTRLTFLRSGRETSGAEGSSSARPEAVIVNLQALGPGAGEDHRPDPAVTHRVGVSPQFCGAVISETQR